MKDHPSMASGQGYSVQPAARTSGQMAGVRPASPSGDAPELELSTRHAPKPPSLAPLAPPPKKPVPPQKPSGAPAKAPSNAPHAAGGGAEFDADDIFAAGGGIGSSEPIELEMPVGAPAAKPAPIASQHPLSPPTGTGLAPMPVPTHVQVSRDASGRVVALSDDQVEARKLADYGESPTSFWQAPLYAYRVKTRQSELRRQLGEREADLARAQKAEEEARVAFAERARPLAERLEGYAEVVAPLVQTEREMLARDGALSAEVEAHKARLAVIDDRVRGLTAELDAAKAEEREIEAKLSDADAIRQRAEAKLKRAEIEIRNATSVADSAGVKGGAARRAGAP